MKLTPSFITAAALTFGVWSAQAKYDATICGKNAWGAETSALHYYPNAWNEKSPKDGFVCMKVDNSTPAYDTTWNWDTSIQDVHSFPYVRFGSEDLPMRLSKLKSIQLSTNWIMTSGNPSKPPRTFTQSVWEKNKAELTKNNTQANAAWDFFLDDDRTKSLSAQNASIEFMVWLGSVGDPWWLGRENSTILSNVTLGKTEFSLYYGKNSGGTHVFTAVTRDGEDVLSLDEDFYPLFQYILKQAHNHPDVPDDLPKDPYVGVVEFGTETWLSGGNVTFTAANFGMKIDGEKEANDASGSSTTNSASSQSSGQNDSSNAAILKASPLWYQTVAAALMARGML